MENKNKIQSFTDLVAWQEGHKLVLKVYKATEDFPKKEIFGLTNQIRRAAVSITSNIAEGFSRHTNNDKCHFYTIALGSLTELQNQLVIARDVKYLSNLNFQHIAQQTIQVSKLLNGLRKAKSAKP